MGINFQITHNNWTPIRDGKSPALAGLKGFKHLFVPASPPPEEHLQEAAKPQRRRRAPSGRKLACPRHLDQPLLGNGRKYYLHLLTSEELVARGMPAGKAKLVINAYPVLVLSSEWLEELYCASCGQKRWYHLTKAPDGAISLRLAPRDLWGQVAHVDPTVPNPTVGEFTRREARRHRDQKRMFE
jgi:hypothetical protein